MRPDLEVQGGALHLQSAGACHEAASDHFASRSLPHTPTMALLTILSGHQSIQLLLTLQPLINDISPGTFGLFKVLQFPKLDRDTYCLPNQQRRI